MNLMIIDGIRVAYDLLSDSLEGLTTAMLADVDACTLAKRRRERATTYRLLSQLLGSDIALLHRPDGSPYVTRADGSSPVCVTITHSRTMAAVAVADRTVGIDMELPSDKLLRIKDKYLSTREQQLCSSDELLLQAWTVKEATYKAAGIEGLPLVGGITITAIAPTESVVDSPDVAFDEASVLQASKATVEVAPSAASALANSSPIAYRATTVFIGETALTLSEKCVF